MNESILQSLMRLFAIIASVNEEGHARNERDVVVEYLQRQFSFELVQKYLGYYDRFLKEYHLDTPPQPHSEQNERTELVTSLYDHLNRELEQPQKMFILVFLLDFINKGEAMTEFEFEFIRLASNNLRIKEDELKDAIAFTFDEPEKVVHKENLLYIDSNQQSTDKSVKHLHIDKIDGRIKVLHLKSTNTYVLRYNGNQVLTLNGHEIKADRSYIWALGSVLKNPRFGSIYYTWVAGRFIQDTTKSTFVFEAHEIEFSYGNSNNGVKPFNLNEESGRLIGIIGGSGSGKSTLIKLLSGVIKPRHGSIRINGLDIHKHSEELKGIIGYVPQEDFLIKELSVFQNLYINARLAFSHYTLEQINEVVENALLNFDLVEARDLRVGDAFNTYLSGGQRKRLNIALELLREPAILFVDEPTSGLSSADSEKVMNLLKRQTFKGKLVFANIHQPSADIFRLLDKLLVVDQGGRVIYYGNPLEAINYFKRAGHFVDAEESECLTCGNIEVDEILRNVEARVVDVNGRLTRNRKTSPSEWYQLYMTQIDPIIRKIKRHFTSKIPQSQYRIPSRWQQLRLFFTRDILAKSKNRQYIIITLLEAPVLAVLLAFYTRSSRDVTGRVIDYTFGLNNNIPAYLFMAVIVALFLGLVISAEEIFKDRKILERERFLSLSRFSYLNSKVVILFGISAIQMLLFVLIGNHILEIRQMTWRYFLIMFSVSCWANMVGLNISSGFKSVVTIYILVPLILVPQLLFSGVVVEFRNLNKAIYSAKAVPAIGDMMTSRWAYEAFMVTQFKDNPFQKDFFEQDRQMDQAMFKKAYVIPELESRLTEFNQKSAPEKQADLLLLQNELSKISIDMGIENPAFNLPDSASQLDENTIKQVKSFFNNAWSAYHSSYVDARNRREKIISQKNKQDADDLLELKRKYNNNKVESVVKNENELVEYIVMENEIIRLRNPIYTPPVFNNGRSHFYASYKKIGGLKIDTFWFDLIIIWLSTMVWFAILYFDILRKIITYTESIRLQRFNRRVLKLIKQTERRA